MNKHREKLRQARRYGGRRPKGFSVFDLPYWTNRAANIQRRILKKHENKTTN